MSYFFQASQCHKNSWHSVTVTGDSWHSAVDESSHLEAEFRLADELVFGSNNLRLTVVDGAYICINDLNVHTGDDVIAHAGA